MSVLANDIGLRCKSIPDVRHIPQIDCRIADHLDRKIIQLGNRFGTRVHIEVILGPADFGGPGRKHQVLLAQRENHIGGRQAF